MLRLATVHAPRNVQTKHFQVSKSSRRTPTTTQRGGCAITRGVSVREVLHDRGDFPGKRTTTTGKRVVGTRHDLAISARHHVNDVIVYSGKGCRTLRRVRALGVPVLVLNVLFQKMELKLIAADPTGDKAARAVRTACNVP